MVHESSLENDEVLDTPEKRCYILTNVHVDKGGGRIMIGLFGGSPLA